ncbi:carboxylesterase [uncultured Parasutterella sp.]|uniref:alpha/beta hydrolase n=1 Tax=uncultured Parasutterella sp. TaxID=1263098 RepID=UPI0025955BE6|nr:carboxylesterase [uncultured Parasutterella sp.]
MAEGLVNCGEITELGRKDAEFIVIFLHGLSSTGKSFLPVAEYLMRKLGGSWRFILPTAPTVKLTVSASSMPAWFDIRNQDLTKDQDEEGILRSSNFTQSLIRSLIAEGVKPAHIFVGGFSQGGLIAADAVLTGSVRIGGVFSLSSLIADVSAHRFSGLEIPVFIAVGNADPLILGVKAQADNQLLRRHCIRTEFRIYDQMKHEMKSGELNDLADWLLKQAGRGS